MRSVSTAWLDATELAARVAAHELDPQAVVAEHLGRIRDIDGRIHAFVHVDWSASAGSGSLAGVTLAVKDTQPVAGMPWTWATRRWRDQIADRDAVPVSSARRAGVAILGKANTPELAAAVGTANELFPATENPWRAGTTPGGSSGGSAAAVAAGMVAVAFGDDLGGSVRIPASCCGVVGLRPSPGRVPQELPDPTHLNSRGPLARSVRDARLLLAVMTQGEPPPAAPSRLRIAAVEKSTLPAHPACWDACRRAAAALEAVGHRVEPVGWSPEPVAEGYRTVRRVSIGSFPGEPEEFGAGVRRLMVEGRGILGVDYFLAHRRATAAAWETVNTLVEGDFDAVLTPTLGDLPMAIPQVPTFLGEDWDRYTQFVLPVSFSALPAVSVPAGLHDGLPVGVQLVGTKDGEWKLLDLAAELESVDGFGFVPPPGF